MTFSLDTYLNDTDVNAILERAITVTCPVAVTLLQAVEMTWEFRRVKADYFFSNEVQKKANDTISPCAAEALRSVRQVKINGIMTGFAGLNESIAAVRKENLTNESAIRASLMNRIRTSNYIPLRDEEAYAAALIEQYHKALLKSEEEKNED